MAEIIIPTDSTTGAIEAKVPKFIKDMVSQVYTDSQRKRFMYGLTYYNESAESSHNKSFIGLRGGFKTLHFQCRTLVLRKV